MTWSPRRRLVAFSGGVTMAVGLLAGLLLQMVFPMDYSQSLLEARFGWTVVAAASEWVGYRLVAGLFPENALKRRSLLAYVTVMNLLLAPLVALVLFALFP